MSLIATILEFVSLSFIPLFVASFFGNSFFPENKYVIYFQLLNFDLIKDVIKIVDKDGKYKNEDDIKKNIMTIENQGKTFRILNKEFTDLISSYLGST